MNTLPWPASLTTLTAPGAGFGSCAWPGSEAVGEDERIGDRTESHVGVAPLRPDMLLEP